MVKVGKCDGLTMARRLLRASGGLAVLHAGTCEGLTVAHDGRFGSVKMSSLGVGMCG